MDSGRDSVPRRRLSRAEAKARTRELLLQAAARTFARKGFAGASVEEIAEAAGFSVGALYSNFGGKEDLFLALSEAYRGDLIAAAGDTVRSAEPGGGDLGRLLVDAAEKNLDFALLHSEFWLYAARNPDVRQAMSDRTDAPRQSLEALVGAELRRRGAPPEVTAESVAAVIAALFEGLVRKRLIDPGSVPDDLFGQALRWIFTGISAGPAADASPGEEEESDR
jgi:AcrR family transcriptional regulator